MKTKPFILGVVPARGGSKGIPDKNVKPFADTSLLEIAIKCANESKMVNDVIVSTDSKKIAEKALLYGGKVPFLRPSELGSDEIPIWRVLKHVIEEYSKNGNPPDYLITLQPTSPFRKAAHIDEAAKILLSSDADSLLSLSEVTHTPYKMRIINEGYVEPFLRETLVLQRQEAPPVYRLNGVVYITRREVIMEQQSIWGKKILPYVLPEAYGMNIDTPEEFSFAEWLYRKNQHTKSI